jgi:voltage-gated potassium channel
VEDLKDRYNNIAVFEGDAGLDEVLLEANVKSAAGIFASTGDDNNNLVISLTAKDLNPGVRVVARCLDASNENKMKKAGADSVITENYIAGMRLASDMLRPSVTSFFDRMFTDRDRNLRLEEIAVHPKHTGKKIIELELENFPNTLLLAVVSGERWIYKPKSEHVIEPESKIVVITNPEERLKLHAHLVEE